MAAVAALIPVAVGAASAEGGPLREALAGGGGVAPRSLETRTVEFSPVLASTIIGLTCEAWPVLAAARLEVPILTAPRAARPFALLAPRLGVRRISLAPIKSFARGILAKPIPAAAIGAKVVPLAAIATEVAALPPVVAPVHPVAAAASELLPLAAPALEVALAATIIAEAIGPFAAVVA